MVFLFLAIFIAMWIGCGCMFYNTFLKKVNRVHREAFCCIPLKDLKHTGMNIFIMKHTRVRIYWDGDRYNLQVSAFGSKWYGIWPRGIDWKEFQTNVDGKVNDGAVYVIKCIEEWLENVDVKVPRVDAVYRVDVERALNRGKQKAAGSVYIPPTTES
jgi:hypothetical protein